MSDSEFARNQEQARRDTSVHQLVPVIYWRQPPWDSTLDALFAMVDAMGIPLDTKLANLVVLQPGQHVIEDLPQTMHTTMVRSYQP